MTSTSTTARYLEVASWHDEPQHITILAGGGLIVLILLAICMAKRKKSRVLGGMAPTSTVKDPNLNSSLRETNCITQLDYDIHLDSIANFGGYNDDEKNVVWLKRPDNGNISDSDVMDNDRRMALAVLNDTLALDSTIMSTDL
jgi:hypothetical protein